MLYLDYNATTPVVPEALAAMQEGAARAWGNPSSLHRAGVEARRCLEAARESIACLIGAEPAELVFTSGGTEANNLAIHGVMAAMPERRLITSSVEHPSVLHPARACTRPTSRPALELPVDGEGRLDQEMLVEALREQPCVVSLMWANNETGVLFPLEVIAPRVRAAGGILHSDAIQAAGRVAIDVRAVGIDLLSLSAHKFGGPKGVGVLYRRRDLALHPLLLGGAQEGGQRAGTPNVPGILGMAAAATRALRNLDDMRHRVCALRDRLEAELLAACPGARVQGAAAPRLPNTTHLRFPGVSGDALLYHLDDAGLAVSTGSACSAGRLQPSHVLMAMGIRGGDADSALRFSLGSETTESEIATAIPLIASLVRRATGGRAARHR